MSYFLELKQSRREALEASKAIVRAAERERRGMSKQEREQLDELNAQIIELDKRIEPYARLKDLETAAFWDVDGDGTATETAKWFARAATAVYREKQVRGITTSSGAGTIDTDVITGEVIPALQHENPLGQAGVQFVAYADNSKTAKVTGTASAAFLAEGAESSEDTGTTISSINWDHKTLRVGPILVSREALDDGGARLDAAIENSLMRPFNDKLVEVFFTGNGTTEPAGLKETSGVNWVSVGGTWSNFDKIVDVMKKCARDKADITAMSFMAHPETWGQLGKLKDSTNQPLQMPSILEGVPKYFTTGVGATEAWVGDFRKAIVSLRGPVKLVLDQRWSTTLQVGFMLYCRVAMAFEYPEHFGYLYGITSAAPTT